jgi:hypothetical protein
MAQLPGGPQSIIGTYELLCPLTVCIMHSLGVEKGALGDCGTQKHLGTLLLLRDTYSGT